MVPLFDSIISFVYISSGFADPKNSGAYLRYKGEVEEELKKLNFTKLGIMRPSFLLGNRKEKRYRLPSWINFNTRPNLENNT